MRVGRVSLALALVLAAWLPAQDPGWDGIASSDPPPRPAAPRDGLDALVRGQPGGDPELEEWYAKWGAEFDEAGAGSGAEPLAGAEAVFGGLFGEPAWTAGRNQRIVLRVLDVLTPPAGDDPGRAALAAAMLDALAERVASTQAPGRSSPRPDRTQVRRGLEELANRPQGITERDEDALRRLGVTVWDYKAAAFVLLSQVRPQRIAADASQVDEILDSPPDPIEDEAAPQVVDELDRRIRQSSPDDQPGRARLVDLRSRLARLHEERRAHRQVLVGILGERAMTSGALMAAAYRRKLADPTTSSATRSRMEAALLGLARVEAQLGDLGEVAELPSPGSVPVGPDPELFVALSSEDLGSKIRDDLLDADVRLSAKLFDLDLIPGVSLSSTYRWELEGRVKENTWTRVDEWRLRGAVRAGDLLKDVFELPFSVNLDHEREILLVRQFDAYGAALGAVPRTPLSLPFTVARARDLPVGWFWSLPVRLQAAASLVGGYTQGLLSASGYANYVVRGRFRLNFFKEGPDHLRVQLIGAHERGPGAGVEAKLGVDVFGIRVLDRALERLLDLRLLDWDHSRRKGAGIAIDYVYDLRDGEAGKAFESAVRLSLGFGGLLATNPRLSAGGMQDRLLTDLRPTERLFLEDRLKLPGERRVDRRFLGTNTFTVKESRFRIGPRLARYGRNRRWVENQLVVTGPEGGESRYRFPMYSFWSGWALLFGARRESREVQAFSLMAETPGERIPRGPQGLVLTASFRDRSASRGEVEDLKAGLVRTLGPALSATLGLGAAPVPSGGKGLEAAVVVAFHPPASVRLLSPQGIPVETLRQAAARTAAAFEDPPGTATGLVDDLLLVREVPGEAGGATQVEALLRLADSEAWRSFGPRFLIEALGGSPDTSEVHVEAAWRGKSIEPFAARYGEPQHGDLLKIVSQALSAVSDRDRPLE